MMTAKILYGNFVGAEACKFPALIIHLNLFIINAFNLELRSSSICFAIYLCK